MSAAAPFTREDYAARMARVVADGERAGSTGSWSPPARTWSG